MSARTATTQWKDLVAAPLLAGAPGVAVFLGIKNIPGFTPVLHVVPLALHSLVVPLSIFLMGVISLAVTYYSERKGRLPARRSFGWLVVILVASTVGFIAIHMATVVNIPIGDGTEVAGVVVGFGDRFADCPCGQSSDARCVAMLTLEPGSATECWSATSIKTATFALACLYLILTTGIGALAGLIVVKRRVPSRTTKRARRRTRQSPGDTSSETGAVDHSKTDPPQE